MALFEWKEQMSVKVESIDLQHKKLVGMLNNFYDQINKKSSNQLIIELISKMRAYASEHFKTEEELFDLLSYPDADEHKQEHFAFINKVREVEEKLTKGQMIVTFELTTFLKDWLKNHIQVTDQQYAEFMVRHGVN